MNRSSVLKFVLDTLLWTALTPLAFLLRLEGRVADFQDELLIMTAAGLPIKAAAVYGLGLMRQAWRRVSLRDLYGLAVAVGLVTLALAGIGYFSPHTFIVPRSVPLIEGMLALLVLGGVRLLLRVDSERVRRRSVSVDAKRVLIVGAGNAGTRVSRELNRYPEMGMVPVGYVDDDPEKQRQRLVGVPVLGPISKLAVLVRTHNIDEIVIALPSYGGDVIRRVVEQAQEARVKHRILPSLRDLIGGKVSVSELREVEMEDLLQRDPVRLEMAEIASYLEGRVVLVTGAGGSIGAEILRQVARFEPAKLVLLGRGENSVFHANHEMAEGYPGIPRCAVIADIRDEASLRAVFESHRPEVVFHAAAHKHVPLMEANPEQAVFNNVLGTQNLVGLALEYGVSRFVNISTDKAVNPTSVMGASKRVAEMVVRRAAGRCPSGSAFVSVRFGNVLGSRGSVIPLFKAQIARGGPVTVTHPDMVRYFMTIPEATQLVLQAGSMGHNGAVYVLDMGEPVRIVDLARDLILLCGKKPEVDVKITFSGIRPGEKLFEELLMAEEGTLPSAHEKIFVARSVGDVSSSLETALSTLVDAADNRSPEELRLALQTLVPSYTFEESRPALPAEETQQPPQARSTALST